MHRAERVVEVQRESQAASSPHLGFAADGGLSFQAREIGPHDARVDTASLAAPSQLEEVARVQAAGEVAHQQAAVCGAGEVVVLNLIKQCQLGVFTLAHHPVEAHDDGDPGGGVGRNGRKRGLPLSSPGCAWTVRPPPPPPARPAHPTDRVQYSLAGM